MRLDDTMRAEKRAKWLDQLKDADATRRLTAASKLCRLGKEAVPAVPALVACLKDASMHVRKMAALALGDIGEPVDVVVPALLDALADTDAGVRRRAAVALTEIMGDSMTALLLVQARLSVAPPELRQQINDALCLAAGGLAAA